MKRENAVLLHFFKKIATTWINLQDAYTVEASTVGTWAQIGYNAPGTYANSTSTTTNFKYSDDTEDDGSQSVWTAEALVTLNDCTKGGTWTATAKPDHDADKGTTYVGIETGGEPLCTGLTPSFDKLTRTTN